MRVICSLFVLLFALSATLLAQRADRAAITGVVSDPSGSNVPGATVRIRNDDTGVETALTTNTAGAYTSPSLVLEGPYRFTRNPMYVGMTLLQVAIGLALGIAWVVVGAALSLTVVHFAAVLPEERYLEEKFGEDYRQFCARVHRYL